MSAPGRSRRGRVESGIIVLDDSDEDVAGPSMSWRGGGDGQGCSYAPKDEPPSDSDDDGGQYTDFYRRLGMN